MSQMPGPYPANIDEIVGQLASQGKIDPVENIRGDKVYIWHGTQDSVVPYCEYFYFWTHRSSWSHILHSFIHACLPNSGL